MGPKAGRDRQELALGRARLDALDQFAASVVTNNVRARFVQTSER